ncbi:hypothetical protein ECC02_008987 [Trypanosoma cruzi]|uniref:Uncharacterized protein n=1 Tax=Trypanosoma cruzi TaxID=5693 RepID=A0A7J6XUG7_TRYCR|nr:hypothetical protein ECC02_008987 [Trypanosoma cruzi]
MNCTAHTTRSRTVTIVTIAVIIAVIITRSGVAGVSEPIRETEGKGMEQEGEGRSAADTERESRQHEERAAGPAAQFTHHETAPTQGRHTTPAATHHAGGEDIHHHLPQLIATAPGKWQKPAATTPATRSEHPPHQPHAQANPHPSMTRQKNFQPSRPPWDTEPNSTQPHAVHHSRRKRDSGCALPLPPPFSSWPRKKTTAATRNCQHALQKEHSNPLQFASCVCVCACRNTKQRSRKEGAECVERRTKMYSRDAWRKQQEEDRSNS